MSLFQNRRFLFLFLTQLFGAFNDNIFKSALTVLMTYRLASEAGMKPETLGPIGGALFILPFVLFSATSGQIADRYEKGGFIRWIKLAEVLIALFGLLALVQHHIYSLLVLLFLMGAHSAVFGPVKYGMLPQIVKEKDLLAANGVFEGSTFLAILLGTIYGGLFVMEPRGAWIIGLTCSTVAVLGLLSSYLIPHTPPLDKSTRINWNIATETLKVIGHARASRTLFRTIMGISWFWLIGAVILSLIPVFASQVLHADQGVTTFLLGLFSVGVAVGSLLAQRFGHGGRVRITQTPFMSLGISACGIVLVAMAMLVRPPATGPLLTIMQLLPQPAYLVMFAAFVGLSAFGGLFLVPLNAFMQQEAGLTVKSRIVAACNVYNAIFMVIGSTLAAILLEAGLGLPLVILLAMLANLGVAVYIRRIVR